MSQMKIKKGDVLDIELPTSEGKIFNLKETNGKKILLTFYQNSILQSFQLKNKNK